MRVSLDRAHIFASDVELTLGFFQRMFGATVVWDERVGGVRLQLGRVHPRIRSNT